MRDTCMHGKGHGDCCACRNFVFLGHPERRVQSRPLLRVSIEGLARTPVVGKRAFKQQHTKRTAILRRYSVEQTHVLFSCLGQRDAEQIDEPRKGVYLVEMTATTE